MVWLSTFKGRKAFGLLLDFIRQKETGLFVFLYNFEALVSYTFEIILHFLVIIVRNKISISSWKKRRFILLTYLGFFFFGMKDIYFYDSFPWNVKLLYVISVNMHEKIIVGSLDSYMVHYGKVSAFGKHLAVSSGSKLVIFLKQCAPSIRFCMTIVDRSLKRQVLHVFIMCAQTG